MMQPLKILTGPNPILERVCRPNATIRDWTITEMFRLLRQNKGLGLAAPQVGIDARFFIVHWGEIFINPVLTAHGEHQRPIQEACLSFPGHIGVMQRWNWIEINGHRYLDEAAIIVQHELDHLNGITILNGA